MSQGPDYLIADGGRLGVGTAAASASTVLPDASAMSSAAVPGRWKSIKRSPPKPISSRR